MRTIGVVTVGRSDYGIYVPVLKKILSHPDLRLHLIVAGMHWLPEYGSTFREIESDGLAIGDKVQIVCLGDTPGDIAGAMGSATSAFATSYAKLRPDILVVLGDRFEMHAAALAALPFKIPVAHIHGGELTRGAFDDALRHSITKAAHLHFVATEEYARRVKQLGEEPWRVVLAGAPALDHLATMKLLDRTTLAERYHVTLDGAPLLVTYHPVTLEYEKTEWQVTELLGALEAVDVPLIFTSPNADTSNRIIRKLIERFVDGHKGRAQLVTSFGPEGYFSMMAESRAMVGNSSSGLVEAPSFGLPVVNIGTRQGGRVRARNVIDVGYHTDEIQKGITTALSSTFRQSLKGMVNPYGDGHASEKIVAELAQVLLSEELIMKRFVDIHVIS